MVCFSFLLAAKPRILRQLLAHRARIGVVFERKSSGSSLTSDEAKNLCACTNTLVPIQTGELIFYSFENGVFHPEPSNCFSFLGRAKKLPFSFLILINANTKPTAQKTIPTISIICIYVYIS